MSHHLNVADGHLTDQGFERVLMSVLSPRPGIRVAALRTAVTPSANVAPLPPDYNAAVRAAAKVAQPPAYVYPRQASVGAPTPPSFADFNAAVCRKAQADTRR